MSKAIEVSEEISRLFWFLNDQNWCLKQKIENLKCCGNCKHLKLRECCFETGSILRVCESYKCDHWQKL